MPADRDRCRLLIEIAREWRQIARARDRRIEALEASGRTTPDPQTLADTLHSELQRLQERSTA